MKVTSWFLSLILFLEVVLHLSSTDGLNFVKVSVPTAFALITAAVKIKALIVKILFGLKAFGVEGIVWRRRRRKRSLLSHTEVINKINNTKYRNLTDESILTAWMDLQATLNRRISFNLQSCIKSTKFRRKKSWASSVARLLLVGDPTTITSSDDDKYSQWVSGLIGSMTRTEAACHLLQQELLELSMSTSNMQKKRRKPRRRRRH